jgi:hypothetical protein
VDASELAWHRAMSLTALDERHAAVDLFRLAYETRPMPARRARYNDLAHLVEAEVGVRAWRDAEPDLERALTDAPDVRSARTATVLRRAGEAACRSTPPAPSTASDLSRLLLAALEGPRSWQAPPDLSRSATEPHVRDYRRSCRGRCYGAGIVGDPSISWVREIGRYALAEVGEIID